MNLDPIVNTSAYDRTPDISVVGFKIEVPSDLLEIRGVELEGERALTPAADSQYFNRYQGANPAGLTQHYTRLRDSAEEVYQIWPIQGGLASAVNIYYYARFDLGDLPGDSNRVLQTHPALYLFGALLEAAPYLKFTSDIPIWQGRYDQAFIGAMANTHESEYAGGSAQVASVHGD